MFHRAVLASLTTMKDILLTFMMNLPMQCSVVAVYSQYCLQYCIDRNMYGIVQGLDAHHLPARC